MIYARRLSGCWRCTRYFFFFFNDTATTEIYTLSLHDALPIYLRHVAPERTQRLRRLAGKEAPRSEEHTSELQSRSDLVCRLLLEKKKQHAARFPRPDATHRLARRCAPARQRGAESRSAAVQGGTAMSHDDAARQCFFFLMKGAPPRSSPFPPPAPFQS